MRQTSWPYEFQPGDMVAVRFGGILWHYGVVTSRGTVISNSRLKGGVIEESFAAFADGRPVRRCGRTDHLDAYAVERRARKAKGARYDLAASNCSHFTRWTYRRRPTALQVASATIAAFKDLAASRRSRW
ncbi:MAG: hypothetical protein GYB42_00030 [Alphaproteobacteria bacterium]|jgi:hypothetical protein|nr:hypothetical protein [Alphaproteobacteria bacterium]